MTADEREPSPDIVPGDRALPSRLPSGRELVVRVGEDSEEIEIRSPSGELELAIGLTPTGPVLRIRGARLEIESSDALSVNCRHLQLRASESMELAAGGPIGIDSADEIRMRSTEQTFIDGDYVNLNCLDRKGYHDDPDRSAESPPEECD